MSEFFTKPLCLLNSVTAWDHYRDMVRTKLGTSDVNWGAGPSEYPCLVVSCCNTVSKQITSHFFYADDARKLLGAGGQPGAMVALPESLQPAVGQSYTNPVMKIVNEAKAAIEAVTVITRSTKENARYVAANLLTIVNLLTT